VIENPCCSAIAKEPLNRKAEKESETTGGRRREKRWGDQKDG